MPALDDDVRSVAVIAAMTPEIRPLVRRLSLARVGPRPGRTWTGTASGRTVVAAITTMGPDPARETTRRVLADHDVGWVIAIGVCGAIDADLAIGDLIVPERTYDESTDTWATPTSLAEGGAAGTLLTTDKLYPPEALAELRERGYVAVDMETGAIGAVCEDAGVPWSVLRAVSDRVGDPLIDADLVGMGNSDGTADLGSVVRFVVRRPHRIPKLAELAKGLRAAVGTTTDATLAAIGQPD